MSTSYLEARRLKIPVGHAIFHGPSVMGQIHTTHTKHTVLDLFHVCSNHEPSNNCGQESKNNLQFMILTYL